MSLKPKTSKRLLALGGIVLLLAAGAGGAVVYRNHRQKAQIDAFRTEGMAFVEQGEYYRGLGSLSKYLKRNDGDLDALLAYAKARENIEEPDGAHIKQALDIYQKVQSLSPSDETAEHLLELYQVAGYLPEARDLAAKMRPENLAQCTDEHFDLLRAEANARMGIKPDDERISVLLARMLELRPTDFPTQVVLVEHLRDRGNAGEGRAIAQKLLDSSDATAKAQGRLLMALARRDEPGFDVNAEAFQALCALTGIDLETAGIAREVKFATPLEVLRSASLFDGMGMHAHALTVLRVGFQQHNDDILARVLARRSWMSGRFNDVLTLFAQPDLGIRGTNSEILVYRALALLGQGKNDEVKTIIDAFAKREGDFRAAAWGPVLQSLVADPQPTPADRLTIIEKALTEATNDPVLLVFQGDALERLGRLGDARASWEKASTSSLALGWVQPWLKRANLALAQGRPLAAVQAAIPAMRIAPRSMGVFSTYFRSNVALIEAGYGDQVNGDILLSTANRIDDELALSEQTPDIKNFRENILPGRVLLTSRVRGGDQARNTLEKGLNALGELSPEALGELFQIAQRENIDADTILLPRMDKAEGMTPRTGLARASSLFKQGKRDEAIALLRENHDKAPAEQKKSWLRAQAAFAESANLPDAKGNWAAFADAYPGDIDAQLAALASPVVQTDLTLVDRLIARTRELGRFDELNTPAQLRMARARALLTEPVDRNRRAEAINVLRDLSLRESDLLEARALLVAALSMDRPDVGIVPQRTDAITQLRTLIPLVPDPTPWQLELARLLRGEGDLAGARGELDRLANTPKVPLNVRLAATEELIRMRELNSAASALERMRTTATEQEKPLIDLTLANAYRAMVRDREALALFRGIDPQKMQTPQQVLALAEGLASLGDKDRAQSALTRADQLPMTPGQAELVRARYLANHGTLDETIAMLRQGVTKAPQSLENWASFVSFLVERKDTAQAKAVLAEARAVMPNNDRLAMMQQQLEVTGGAIASNMDLQQLADVVAKDPQRQDRAKFIRDLDASRSAGRLGDPAELDRLKTAAAVDPALLVLTARVLATDTPPRLQGAAQLIRETMASHPANIEAAVLGVDIYRSVSDWNSMLNAAMAWQQLTRAKESDVAVAEARLNLGQRDAAVTLLRTRLTEALANPADDFSFRVLNLYGRGLVADNKAAQAFDELAPAMEKSQLVRTGFWLPVAGGMLASEPLSRRWLDRATPHVNVNDESEALTLAGTLAQLAARFPETATTYATQAMAIIRPLTSRPQPSARALEAQGTLEQISGKISESKASFAKALERDPRSIFALRGLAQLHLGDDADKAADFADKAVQLGGPDDLISLSIAAQAFSAQADSLTARNQPTAAAQSWEKARLAFTKLVESQPNEVMLRLGLIRALDGAGRVADTITNYESLINARQFPAGVERWALLNNFADALVRANRNSLDIERAKGLITEAIQVRPDVAALYDTLAHVEVARSDRAAAIAAYRKAVQLDAQFWASWMGLARLLKDGSPEEASEAATIIDKLRSEADKLPADLRSQLTAIAGEK
ncbi:MAG: hypothetical protein ACK5ZG_09685 [Phycisphaerae bacterium]|jgi:tetratricopeptide (TPR) repeat protein